MIVVCNEIRKVQWLQTQRVLDESAGDYVENPVGTLCLVHGLACDVWPLEDRQDVVSQALLPGPMQKQFHDITEGVKKALVYFQQKSESVMSNVDCGVTMSRKMAFVHADVYNARVSLAAGSQGSSASVSELPGYNRELTHGVVLEMQDLPPDMPFDQCKVWSTVYRRPFVLVDVISAVC